MYARPTFLRLREKISQIERRKSETYPIVKTKKSEMKIGCYTYELKYTDAGV